jgi:hypothetical protein
MAARLFGGLRQENVANEILEHLEGIQENLRRLWGRME